LEKTDPFRRVLLFNAHVPDQLIEFWRWAYSDMRSNTVRPLVAEYLVGRALGCLEECGRREWAAWDHEYRGKRIEVKSAGYVQAWSPATKSAIKFGIESAKNAWCAKEEKYLGPGRHAHIYVFALNTQTDRELAGLLDEKDWRFFVVPVAILNERFSCQKSISLGSLKKCVELVDLSMLKEAVDQLC
jgi:hypothetical protein